MENEISKKEEEKWGKESEVNKHYTKIAKELGINKDSTMKDINIRDLETDSIIDMLQFVVTYFNEPKVLEVGCGNGYLAEQLHLNTSIKNYAGTDFNAEMIKVAKSRNIEDYWFDIQNVLNLSSRNDCFDIVICQRCIINLLKWDEQQKAIKEIYRVLKPKGVFIMVESFNDNLNILNEARDAVGLLPIKVPFHNLYFDEIKFNEFIKGMFIKFEENNMLSLGMKYTDFLSSYYFGSKVLYPALIEGKKEIVYNNKFLDFFRQMPSYGEYGVIKMYVLQKVLNEKV